MKKLISSVVIAAILICALSTCIFAYSSPTSTLNIREDNSYSVGDINSDGAVNSLDAYALKSYIASFDTDISVDAADFNADGSANAVDVFYLKCIFTEIKSVSDFENGFPIYSLKIAGNTVDNYDIVVAADTDTSTSNAYLSALILQTYIEKGCGYNMVISFGESTKKFGIYYHQLDFGSAQAEKLELGVENYLYRIENGDLHIYGTVRGCMYATYEIIENHLGFRFYSDKNTYVYNARTVDIPADTDVYFRVPYEFRFSGGTVANSNALYQYYYALGCNGTPIYTGGEEKDGYSVGPRFILGHSFGYFRNIQSVPMPAEGDLQKRLSQKYINGNQANSNTDPTSYNEWQPCCSADEAYYEMFNGLLEITQMIQSWGSQNRYSDDTALVSSYAMTWSINDALTSCICKPCRAKVNGDTVKLTSSALKCIEKNYTGDYSIENGKITFKKEGVSGLFTDFCNRAAKEITTEYRGHDYTYGDGGDFESLHELDPEIRTVYENMQLNMIIYNHTVPESVRPLSNIQIMYVSHGCYNHVLGTGECGDGKTVLNGSNIEDDYAIKAWGEICNESGASIWYYSHGVNYACTLCDSPNVTDFYWNAKYIRQCGFNGILFEGYTAGQKYETTFENLKGYLASKMAFNPDMTYDEFTLLCKEWMYMYYGDGFDEVYQYMLLLEAAGDAAPCWTNNHDRPFDQYEPSYIKAHYEEMRELVMTAISKASDSYEEANCRNLLVSCDFLGLSACYKDMYTNGTDESKKLYEERYTNLYNYIVDNSISTYRDEIYPYPATVDCSSDPMVQFIGFASWRGIDY